MKIIAVNGIRTHGENNVDLLLEALKAKGFQGLDFEHPRRSFVTGRMGRYQLADGQKLFDESLTGDSVVAHSRGALTVLRAMQLGRQFGAVFLFGPALDRDTVFPDMGAGMIHVIHNPFDRVLRATKLAMWGDFGTMGVDGASMARFDEGIVNVPAPSYRGFWSANHSFYFLPGELEHWARYVAGHAVLPAMDRMARKYIDVSYGRN